MTVGEHAAGRGSRSAQGGSVGEAGLSTARRGRERRGARASLRSRWSARRNRGSRREVRETMRGVRARVSRGRTEDDLQRAPRRVHDGPLDGVGGVAHGDGRFVSCRVPARAPSGPRAAVGLHFKRKRPFARGRRGSDFRQTRRASGVAENAFSLPVSFLRQTGGHRRGAPCRRPCTTRSR